MHRIDKMPSYCPSVAELQAGDILIFNLNPARMQGSAGAVTVSQQKILNEEGGHKDVAHTGYVVEINGRKKLAHLRANGFILDDLDVVKTTTHVYRPMVHRERLAAELSAMVARSSEELRRNLKWRFLAVGRSYVRRLFTSLGIVNTDINTVKMENVPDKDVTGMSLCSKFVADSYISACYNMTKIDPEKYNYRRDLMNISPFTIPKTLQAYLYRNSNFQYMVMPVAREELYNRLKQSIASEAQRLQRSHSPRAKQKAEQISRILAEFDEREPQANVFAKSVALLKAVVPALLINTGNGVRTPDSYTQVMEFANAQGIYDEYLDANLHDNNEEDPCKLATHQYSYPQCIARLYAEYRKLGYSDKEARFECEPNFSDWLALSSRRNIAAGITGVGFLFGSLPYGLFRVISAGQRNETLLHTAEASEKGKERLQRRL